MKAHESVIKFTLKEYILFPLVIFAVLFDTDGSAYGTLYLTDNAFLIAVGGFIGNLLWVFGVLLFFIAAILIALVHQCNKEEIVKLASARRTGGMGSFWSIIGIFTIILLLGSGFWFTGLAWLVVTITTHILMKAADNIKREMHEAAAK